MPGVFPCLSQHSAGCPEDCARQTFSVQYTFQVNGAPSRASVLNRDVSDAMVVLKQTV